MKKIFVPLVASLLAGLTAQASVFIINEDFNAGLSAGANITQYGPGGDGTSFSNGVIPSGGVGNTGAWQEVLNAASGANGFSYLGGQYQNGGVTGNTSAVLGDYTLSFDAMANAGSLNIQIQSWSGAGFGGSFSGTLNTAPNPPGYGNDLTLTSAFTHYSLNLGNSTIFPQNTGFLPNGGTIQIAMQLDGGGPTPYSDTLTIDNFQLTMVPEPTILALSGMGISLTGMLIRRRLV